MVDQPRAGVRGGRDRFSWDAVKLDRDRVCYIGNSVRAPVGRWQMGKDLYWYAKNRNERKDLALGSTLRSALPASSSPKTSIESEKALIKAKEQEYMDRVLLYGFASQTDKPEESQPAPEACDSNICVDGTDFTRTGGPKERKACPERDQLASSRREPSPRSAPNSRKSSHSGQGTRYRGCCRSRSPERLRRRH